MRILLFVQFALSMVFLAFSLFLGPIYMIAGSIVLVLSFGFLAVTDALHDIHRQMRQKQETDHRQVVDALAKITATLAEQQRTATTMAELQVAELQEITSALQPAANQNAG
jgi:cobalamin biosynthesis protein CobD/CbiB